MAILSIEAVRSFSECIQENIPALEGRVCEGQANFNHKLKFPSLVINPIKFTYFPEESQVWNIPDPTSAIIRTGRYETVVELRLGATTAYQRAEYEQAILDLFMYPRNGIYLDTITECYDACAAWELEDIRWSNEAAFEKQLYSVMTVTLQIPALVCQKKVYTIEGIDIQVTENLSILETVQIP